MTSDWICANAMPGFGCNYYEMIVLGFLYCITGFLCLYFLIQHIRSPWSLKKHAIDSNSLFWISMFIWMNYRGILFLAPFNYNAQSLLIVQGGINAILALIPISLLILLICELLFTYHNPGYQTISFFKIVFTVFLCVFLFVGITIAITDETETDDFVSSLALWHGCTDLIILFFAAVPAKMLISAISYPAIQPDDVPCITKSKIGLWTFSILFFFRFLYNTLHFFGINPLETWIASFTSIGAQRAFNAVFSFVFEYATGVMAMAGVSMLRKHDMKFADDPFYARGQSDSLIVAG